MDECKKDKNPLGLEVGKYYWLRYVHCESDPAKVKITRFTDMGYPWQESVDNKRNINGAVTPGCYELISETTTWDEVGRRYAREMFGEDKYLQFRFLDWCKEYYKAPELR